MSSREEKHIPVPLRLLGTFPIDWLETTLTEICTLVTDGTHESPKPVECGGFPLVTGKAIKNREIDFSVTYNISVDEHKKVIERSKTERNDILFANIGNSIGDLVRVQSDKQFSIKNLALFKPDTDKVNPRYLEYYLLSDVVQNFIKGSTKGSAQPFIGLGSLRMFPIAIPSMKEQDWIAEILGPLDDRITLLRETNATLEAIAQALFKSWFVDFDPVRANQQNVGRVSDSVTRQDHHNAEAVDVGLRLSPNPTYEIPAEIAALFPDDFEESELGLVPRGWRCVPLADAYEINPQRKLKKGEMASYLDMASVPTSGHCAEQVIHREMGSGAKFTNGDTLLARITPCLENGKSGFVDFLADNEIGWGSTEFLVLRPKQPLPPYHAYLLCRHIAFRDFAIQSMSGTSGRQRIQNDVLGRYLLAIPPDSVARLFGYIVTPIQQRIAANHSQAQTLATLRDTLLPRLISGQLRLPEVEAMIEQVPV